ncbi:Maf/Ham1 [Fomitiporia mediterranea MF3/22]|uniref:Maf/Ham1 n=1 Tax=Fomitiporia mediterranea (strain MF3/22) TaxID=694068 RepID=UPI0004409727|nr:Maf/Ham1 [Fomitiporia mediterranea MF3/22]EJD01700.1 Maf/Ham1 [Fomitiporia mediterranea MF3/22]
MSNRTLVFVTGNANKLKEVRAILSDTSDGSAPINLESKDFNIPELQGTTQDVAREKCRRAAELVGGPCITEDVALCFKAMNDLPGPYIKHFLKALGPGGLSTLLEGFPTNDAYAICTFAYSAGPGTEPILFEGKTQGKIVSPRGPQDFGWDCAFEAEGTGKTYAEMRSDEKNKISHRSRALALLRAYLKDLPLEADIQGHSHAEATLA